MKNENSRPRAHNHHQDTLGGIITGIFFILAGICIIADNQGYMFDGWLWWFMFAGGILLLVESVIRTHVEKYRRPVTAKIIWGGILTILGGAQLFDIELWWPAILILIGSILIFNAFKTTFKPT